MALTKVQNELLSSQYLNPVGCVQMFAGSVAPSGWLLCQGQAVSRTVYATLFAAISTTYGAGDGSTTFNLPNLQGVFPRGAGTQNRYTFTITSASVTSGAVYSNNSQTFTVLNTISSSTALVTSGSGAPLASGTLTKVSGTGPATITFSANVAVSYSANLGEYQSDVMQGHIHGVGSTNTGGGGIVYLQPPGNSNDTPSYFTKSPLNDGTNGIPRTGLETRPSNVALNYIIKY